MIIENMINKNNCTEKVLYANSCDKVNAQLTKDMGRRCVTFTLHKGESDVLSSKIGGVPFIPQGGKYPVHTDNGKRLHFLMQLNFSEAPHLQGYPENGILQFFIANDGNYGVNWADPQCQNSWRVLYHADITCPMPIEAVKKLMPVVEGNSSTLPFALPGQAFTLEFMEEVIPLDAEDLELSLLENEAVQNLLPDELKGKSLSNLPDDLIVEILCTLDESKSRLGGYARGYEMLKDYVPLLRITSEKEDQECYLKWGENGIANFFIHPDDLKKRDFSKVLYNWDRS